MEKTKGKIMFVDDSENLRYVIKDYLELNGYEVVDFNNTDTAARSYYRHSRSPSACRDKAVRR